VSHFKRDKLISRSKGGRI